MISGLNLVLQARALHKRLTSHFKSEWMIDDYPIRTKHFPTEGRSNSGRRKHVPWVALVINWPGLAGTGDTKREALEQLKSNFENHKNSGKKLPRPGVHVPVEFGSRVRLEHHSDLEKDFVSRVLCLPWAFLSDESSLWDFHDEATNDSFLVRIRSIYGVDVSDIESGNLADIFDRIADESNWSRHGSPGNTPI